MKEKKRVHAFISGRVQGVGYRYFAHRVADSLGVVGEVKNLRDGRVEVIAEGEKAVLEHFLDSLRQGPAFAYVASVEADWSEATGKYRDFSITY